ncbi:MAG: glycosyltransferase, partial [Bacteroidia bacterium]|nr:glycosyltransferase [Bacteroidia bacterium]
IPNVVDTKIFYPAREVEKNSTFEFLHVSSLNDRHKNVSGILEAFAVLLSQGFDAYLTIVGNGFYGKHQNSIDRLSLQSNVSLVKELSIHGIADAMRKSKVLVLFSNYENAPCVISEAHCTGIPVISTNVGGVAEMIDKDNGLLIKPKDQSSLVEAMKWMIKNHIQYDAPAIRQKAVLEYAIDRIAQKYVEVYRRVQSEHGN